VIALRAVEPTDTDWIFEACQDEAIQRWTRVPRPYLRSHAEEFVAGTTAELLRWAITSDDRPIGLIGVHSIDAATDVAEIGYWVAPWGRGQRAVSTAIGLVIDELRVNTEATGVSAIIAEGNAASRRSAERAGLTVSEHRPDGCHDGDSPTMALVYRLDFSRPSS